MFSLTRGFKQWMKTTTLVVLVTWFFLEENKHKWVKIKPFCFEKSWIFHLKWDFILLSTFFLFVCVKSRALNTSFYREKTKKKSSQFSVQQESQKKVPWFVPSSLPFQSSTQLLVISKADAPAPRHPGTEAPTGASQPLDKKNLLGNAQ